MASAETPSSVIVRFADILDAAGVPYMLTGSFASGIYGQPRASENLDTQYVERWVGGLGLQEQWEKAKRLTS